MRKSEELTNPASCMSRAAPEEMTFVLIGRDLAAPAAVRSWIEERVRLGKNARSDIKIVEAEQWIATVLAEQSTGRKLVPGVYRVARGESAGALVRLNFINVSGNADCRLVEDFGAHPAGEIYVVKPEDLGELVALE